MFTLAIQVTVVKLPHHIVFTNRIPQSKFYPVDSAKNSPFDCFRSVYKYCIGKKITWLE